MIIEITDDTRIHLNEDDVEWIVNDLSELGVKINNQCFFLYKGHSIQNSGTRYRRVGKREFGECCHPWDYIKKRTGEARLTRSYEGFYPEESEYEDLWKDIPN